MTFDYLHTQPSHLLGLTLTDLLSKSPPLLRTHTALPSINRACHLPAGHHLVYFPPQVTLSQLLPDGTDVLHSPGEPFNRRLWAGGRLRFPITSDLVLNGARAVCIETIRDVIVNGREGAEKVAVKIERRIGTVQENEEESSIRRRIWKESEAEIGNASVIENRDLVFMRKKTQEELSHDKANFDNNSRIINRAQVQPLHSGVNILTNSLSTSSSPRP
jgi:hydroxyacyl-ACP dehydratase HTD2-like protein with hotdog domain